MSEVVYVCVCVCVCVCVYMFGTVTLTPTSPLPSLIHGHRLIIGLTNFTTKAHLCRATLEADCFQSREV